MPHPKSSIRRGTKPVGSCARRSFTRPARKYVLSSPESRRHFDQGRGLAVAPSLYDAARVCGEQVRRVSDLDREALAKDEFSFNINLLLGGQVGREPPNLYLIYPQGNPLAATEDSPYLQIGESKYGRPILDRGVRYDRTTLEEAAKYALISMDSTMRSNVTVGPPIDLLLYRTDELHITRHRRFHAKDPDLREIHHNWEHALAARYLICRPSALNPRRS